MTNNPLHIVILAAGKGTRMYSSLPKVLHAIGGKPMLTRVIETAQSLSPDAIHVVIGHKKELIEERISAPVNWVAQTEQLGTGHAVKIAAPQLPDNARTLILYGDVPLINTETLKDLLNLPHNVVGLLTDVLDDPKGYGRIIRDAGQIIGIREEKDATDKEKSLQEINTGIMLLPNAKLKPWLNALQNNNAQNEYYLTDIITLAKADATPIQGVFVKHSYLTQGVNNKIQLAQLERILQNNIAQELLANGVTLSDPSRLDVRGDIKHGQDVLIDINVLMEGTISLGNNVTIGAHCFLKNVSIGHNTHIQPFSHLENCTVGEDARIGPYARLRPGATLADHVHIGNFVEVKASEIGLGSKVNHLTYIGDTTIGQNTNIGAGTITCNYDGVNKYRTHIGDDCRVGSGTMLVAPVKLQNKCTTGAGSVITHDCPENQLTLARSQQISIPNWKRPEKNAKQKNKG